MHMLSILGAIIFNLAMRKIEDHVSALRGVLVEMSGGVLGCAVRIRLPTRCICYCSKRKLHCPSASTKVRVLYGPQAAQGRTGDNSIPCVWVGSIRHFGCSTTFYVGAPGKPPADGASLTESFKSSAEWTSDAVQTVVAEVPVSHGQGVGELASLGLGGYTPPGLIQSSLELLHAHAHLPWWLSIITATVVLRVLMFPLAVRMTANATKLANMQPETAAIMKRADYYKQAGNMEMRTQELIKLSEFYQKHGCNPLMMFAMPMLQIPVFISFFFALRKMATAPVESMTYGGTLWFPDLTVADPFFALPLIACLTFLTNVEVRWSRGCTSSLTRVAVSYEGSGNVRGWVCTSCKANVWTVNLPKIVLEAVKQQLLP